MAVNWLGLASIGLFYVAVLATGIWASRKSKWAERKCSGNRSEVAIIGGRDLNLTVSIFTTTATWVGGGYLLGNAEVVYDPTKGLAWVLLPIAFSLSLIIGGLFFVTPVRKKNFVTILDPFQQKYGSTITGLIAIPCVIGDICWVSTVLAALGWTVSVILDISSYIAVVCSAAVAIVYTFLGGLYSVAYTDIIQLIFMFLGLWMCLPFILSSPTSADITVTAVTRLYQEPWLGSLKLEDAGRWLDDVMLLCLGCMCSQAFYQRILSISTDSQAKMTCYVSSVLTLLLAVPSILVGATAASTDWNQTSYGLPNPLERGQTGMILPISLQHLCPTLVSLAGIGAVAASVMSSIDSALLSAASLFARNVYRNIFNTKASERSILLVIKASIVVFGSVAAGLALTTSSIFTFVMLSGDLIYTTVFPQVVCVLFLPHRANQQGAVLGLVVALAVRSVLGEPLLGLPSLVVLPGDRCVQDGRVLRLFPHRTGVMLVSLASVVLGSRLAVLLSRRGLLPRRWDPLGQRDGPKDRQAASSSPGEAEDVAPRPKQDNTSCQLLQKPSPLLGTGLMV